MMRAVTARIRLAVAVVVAAAGLAAAAPSALAASPAWSISAGSEPTSPTTHVVNEVQEVTVEGASGGWELKEISEPGQPVVAAVGPFFTNASAAEVQEKLDEKLGAGTTLVTGGQAEGKPYRIEFIGELSGAQVTIKGTVAFGLTASLHEAAAGSGLASLIVTAVNVGAGTTTGTTTVVAHVPAGFAANSTVTGEELLAHAVPGGKATAYAPASCELAAAVATCTLDKAMIPGDGLRITITGRAEAGVKQILTEASVTGGGAAQATVAHASATDATPTFGIEPGSLVFASSEAGAGGHPNLTTRFTVSTLGPGEPAGFTRSIKLALPTGLIGNPQVTRTCTMEQVNSRACPSEDAVGAASARVATPQGGVITFTAPVFNVVPNGDEPAAFAFNIGFPVRLETSVDPNGAYHVAVEVEDVTQALKLLSTSVTLWGVPAEYNGSRSEEVEGSQVEGPYWNGVQAFGAPRQGATGLPFLDYPTQCSSALAGEVGLTSWPGYNEGRQESSVAAPLPLSLPTATECGQLSFAPALEVLTSSDAAAKPAGYTVKLKVPQTNSAEEAATPEVRDVEVVMPEGTTISPSAANGLAACSKAQLGMGVHGKGNCPTESDIGSVKITSPLLAMPLEGHVYVGEPQCAACTGQQAEQGEMVRLFLEAEGAGVTIKLEGYTEINSTTGRLTTVFKENPQLPFEELELSLKGGSDAPLVNPSACGGAITAANVTPWSSATAAKLTAPAIPISGCGTPGFTPSMQAGMTGSSDGGAFTPFTVTLSRSDGQQALKGVTINTPPGLLGMLSKVQLCGEAQANAGTCPAASQIGTTAAVVGPGANPYEITGGQVYLTEHYGGGAFGLSIVVPAQAGPFHLAGQYGTGAEGDGNVVVRGSISVNPSTAALTITTNPMPEMLDGIPLGVDRVIVDINKAGFMFNPTSCNAMSITGTIGSWAGASANVSTPFQAHDCAVLPFKPVFKVHTHAFHSRKQGAYMQVNVESGSGQANIHKVDVQLPKAFSVEDEALKHSCLESQFVKNPAGCPAESVVGHAAASTPVLSKPMEGAAYFVSHGGLAFPNLDIVLQGEGVTIELTGNTYVTKKGYTFSKFESVPDAPISTFQLVLPEGPHSALAGNGNLCYRTVVKRRHVTIHRHGRTIHKVKKIRRRKRRTLIMPTRIVGQNGAVVEQKTRVSVKGCGGKAAKSSVAHHHGHHHHHHGGHHGHHHARRKHHGRAHK